MDIVFMPGGTALTIYNTVLVLLMFIGLAYFLWDGFVRNPGEASFNPCKRAWVALAVAAIAAFMYGSPNAPKLKIDNQKSYEQIQYDEPKEIIIETPEPRTETLEGFKPLKEE